MTRPRRSIPIGISIKASIIHLQFVNKFLSSTDSNCSLNLNRRLSDLLARPAMACCDDPVSPTAKVDECWDAGDIVEDEGGDASS
jgi:hypothetical protein